MGQGDICKDNVIVTGTYATLWYDNNDDSPPLSITNVNNYMVRTYRVVIIVTNSVNNENHEREDYSHIRKILKTHKA